MNYYFDNDKKEKPALIKQYLNAPSLYKADYRLHLIKLEKANRCDIREAEGEAN